MAEATHLKAAEISGAREIINLLTSIGGAGGGMWDVDAALTRRQEAVLWLGGTTCSLREVSVLHQKHLNAERAKPCIVLLLLATGWGRVEETCIECIVFQVNVSAQQPHGEASLSMPRQKSSEIFTDDDAAFAVLNASCTVIGCTGISDQLAEFMSVAEAKPEEMMPLSWRHRLVMATEGKGLISEPFWLSLQLGKHHQAML